MTVTENPSGTISIDDKDGDPRFTSFREDRCTDIWTYGQFGTFRIHDAELGEFIDMLMIHQRAMELERESITQQQKDAA